MQKKISKLPFKGTAEQAAQLKAVIDANKQDPSRLMFVMQEAQGIYGYLPMEVQQMIADGMNVPLEKMCIRDSPSRDGTTYWTRCPAPARRCTACWWIPPPCCGGITC